MDTRGWQREAIEADLSLIDDWRSDGFDGHRRAALALARQLVDRIGFLSPSELLGLARERRCGDSLPPVETLREGLRDAHEMTEAACREIAERIVDTALLGRDLQTMELEGLVELAYEHGIEHGRMIGDWRSHEELIAASRERLRHAEVFLGSLAMDDLEQYPARLDQGSTADGAQ